jgi:hypothetical protein
MVAQEDLKMAESSLLSKPAGVKHSSSCGGRWEYHRHWRPHRHDLAGPNSAFRARCGGWARLKSLIPPKNPSAKLLGDWSEGDTFVWPVSDEILLEYKRVLARPGVRRPLAGKIVNLLPEDAELVQPLLFQKSHLIPEMLRSVPALKPAAPTSL